MYKNLPSQPVSQTQENPSSLLKQDPCPLHGNGYDEQLTCSFFLIGMIWGRPYSRFSAPSRESPIPTIIKGSDFLSLVHTAIEVCLQMVTK